MPTLTIFDEKGTKQDLIVTDDTLALYSKLTELILSLNNLSSSMRQK